VSPTEAEREIRARAEQVSGYTVAVMQDLSLRVLSTVSMARGDVTFHTVRYNPATTRQPEYLVSYQCGFIIRAFLPPPEKRGPNWMLVYSSTKNRFSEDVFGNRIETCIYDAFKFRLGRSTTRSEISAWANSMIYMNNILHTSNVPDDAGVAIEYQIPQTCKRIDFILTGQDERRRDTAVIVELKQWSEVELSGKDGIVRTYLGGGLCERPHPSYQAWTYAALLQDFNETVYQGDVQLLPCAYLHNCSDGNVLCHDHYHEYTSKAPVFLRRDAQVLTDFLQKYVKYGDSGKLLYRIDQGKIRPSKALADCLVSLLQGNKEFLMIDDQKLVYEAAIELANQARAGQKHVLIVAGGPGTGKSVVAINLLVELTKRQLIAQYVTRNAAPREVYESKLSGSMTKTRITNLFRSSGAFIDANCNEFDVLLVDEAHRLNAKSGMFQNKGENQIKEAIIAANLSVFFLDEDQQVTLKDIGDANEIRKWAALNNAAVHEMELTSQFRCNGSDGYLAWLDNSLQIRPTANENLDGIDFDFRVCDTAAELRNLIIDRNSIANKSRLVAGYCWDWISKKDKNAFDIVFPEQEFAMQWNLDTDGHLWILQPDSVEQIGCIHTCQGLELDYVGVIIGPDFIIRDGVAVAAPEKRARHDRSVHGYKSLKRESPMEAQKVGDKVVKNTYRTLMTRGQKGCYIYCTDLETNLWFKSMMANRRDL
jgi:uncharacterized protein